MFYEEQIEPRLRFGDVIQGFVSCVPVCNNPPLCEASPNYELSVSSFSFLVVLTPCCSIEKGVLSLAPLIKVRPSFFENDYFAEDLTRINQKIDPKYSLPAKAWESMDPKEKVKRLAKGYSYALKEIFIYHEHDLLQRYPLKKGTWSTETGYYMVDFKTIQQTNCTKIQRGIDAPEGTKLLQVSTQIRNELRDKIGEYFGRIPEEDLL